MKYRISFGVLALAAGLGLLLGGPAYALHGGGALGKGSQGYLGVELRDVSEGQVAALKLKDTHGAEVINVDHDGPACKAGVQVHDVILQMNGQAIEGIEQMRRLLRDMPAGRSVALVISRDGQQQTITTQMANRDMVEREAWEQRYKVPEPAVSSGFAGSTGFLSGSTASGATKGQRNSIGAMTMLVSPSFTGAKLEVMGPQLAEFFGAQGSAGLLVRSVDANSPASEAGMRAGDVVVRVNAIPVASGGDWSRTIHENKGKPVAVVVLRDKKEQTLTLVPDGKKRSSVEPRTGLEGFFGRGEQAEWTEEALAEMQPLFDAMVADAQRRIETARYSPEMAQMVAQVATREPFASNPAVKRDLEMARKHAEAAASAAKCAVDSAVRQRMN